VNKNQVPEFDLKESLQKLSFANFSKNKSHAILNRPDVNIINVAQKKERENLKQAKNLFKPKLDLKIEASNDIGNANQALGQSKNLIGLKFEIPFQQRRARGSVGKAESKLRRIEYEKKLLLDKIKVKLDQIRIRINNITEIHDNLTKEVSYSLQLEKAEMQRFKKGGSDFFLINLRETTTAQARIENNKIFAEYYKTLADYAAETFTEIKIDNF
jgi:outer membrane protein TolC